MTANDQKPAIYNYELVQGDLYSEIYTFTSPDLTGATFEGKVLDVKGNKLCDLTIVQSPLNDQNITVSLTQIQTKALPENCKWYFKILTSTALDYRTIWAGDFIVRRKQGY